MRPTARKEEDPLLAFRTRWRRWLAQVCRADRPGWVMLLSHDWLGFPQLVLGEQYEVMPWTMGKERVMAQYRQAIDQASYEQLRRLDGIYCEQAFDKRHHGSK